MTASAGAWTRRGLLSTALAFGFAAATAIFTHHLARAQTEGAADVPPASLAPAAAPPKAAKAKRSRKAETKRPDSKPVETKAPSASPTLAAAAAAGAEKGAVDIAARLTQAGAGACSATIDADAAASMIGVTQSDTVSTWSNVDPRDKHSVNVFVAQRYGGNQAVPFGVTGLIASPNLSGSCDSTVVQVVTSPLPCSNVRDTLLRGGKMEGDLAGISVVRSGENQTLLMPTATNSCVLIGFHSTFRK